jgi:hypothetical protein
MGDLIDFTAYKLAAIANAIEDPDDLEVVLGVLGDYYEGEIAIAWERGIPIIMPMGDTNATSRGIPPGFGMMDSHGVLHIGQTLDDEEG